MSDTELLPKPKPEPIGGWKCLPGPAGGARGRAEQKARIVAESYESGETVSAVARRQR